MKKVVQNKKIMAILSIAIIAILGVSIWFSMRGKISQDEWDSVSVGLSKDTVVEYLGNPKEKVIDQKEIFDSYSFLFTADGIEGTPKEMQEDIDMAKEMPNYPNIEMYTYKLKSNDCHIYFVDGKVIWKN